MFNFIYKNRKGVTILESLIALTLLAVVAVGIFGVVLSISRKTNESDVREETALAMESAIEKLNLYEGAYRAQDKDPNTAEVTSLMPPLPKGLCAHVAALQDLRPLKNGMHDIECFLPPVCDKTTSFFTGFKVTYYCRINETVFQYGLLKPGV